MNGEAKPTLPAFELPHEFGLVQQNRRALLRAHCDIGKGRVLEVGPYDQPTVTKDEADVSYLDVQSREELVRALDDPAVARRIPEVDLLYAGTDYAEAVEGKLDLLIANHVLEHVPNPIAWLRMITGVLAEGGVLFLSLPDKKFTFDRYRPDTPLSHILHDYYSGVTEVTREHVLEIELYYDMEFIGRDMDVASRLDDARLRRSFEIPLHPGIHCHVFQAETFCDKFLLPLQHMGLLPFDLVAFRGARAETGGEFSLLLRHASTPKPVELTAAKFFTKDYEQLPAAPDAPWVSAGSAHVQPRPRLRDALFPQGTRRRSLLARLRRELWPGRKS